jgi:hypothetical protein
MKPIEDYREHYPFALLAVPFRLCGISKEPIREKTGEELLKDAQKYLVLEGAREFLNKRRADGQVH